MKEAFDPERENFNFDEPDRDGSWGGDCPDCVCKGMGCDCGGCVMSDGRNICSNCD